MLENIHAVQQRQNLPLSSALVQRRSVCDVNLDIEMETGTGKTYCYIKTMFELNKRYGWSKFIVVVPSIAIREGVKKSFEITAEHFLEKYGKRARSFIYNSKQLAQSGELLLGRRGECDDHQRPGVQCDRQGRAAHLRGAGRLPVAQADRRDQGNRPILILDEPQKMEGAARRWSR